MAFRRKASVSQIQRFLRCPRSWFYHYKKRIPEPPSIYLIRGSFVHLVCEELADVSPRSGGFNKNNFREKIPIVAKEIFDEVFTRPGEYFGKTKPSVYEDLMSLFENNEELVTAAKNEAFGMLTNYVNKLIINIDMMFKQNGDFSKAYKAIKPQFTEFELDINDGDIQFGGFIDQVFELGGQIVLCDLKTSKLKVGKAIDSDFYMPLGLSGLDPDYELQLLFYLSSYYKLTGKKADYLALNYLAYGSETIIPTKWIDIDDVVTKNDKLISTFMRHTESNNMEDYPMNISGDVKILPHYELENLFCTCHGSRFDGRGYCPYEALCNAELELSGEFEAVVEEPDCTVVKIKDTNEAYTLPFWLAQKKGFGEAEVMCTRVRESEKAILIDFNGDQSWLPKSQLTKIEE